MVIVDIVCTVLMAVLFVTTFIYAKKAEVLNERSKNRMQSAYDYEDYIRCSWPRLYTAPSLYDINIDMFSEIVVVGRYVCGNDDNIRDVVIKKFKYDRTDEEDKAFAIREAEELVDKLRER